MADRNLDVTDRNREGEEIYAALVERAHGGRMGKPLSLTDYRAGLLGPEGRAFAQQARSALNQAGIPFDEADACEFLGVKEG